MGGTQLGFSNYELTTAKKQTKREKFLVGMEVVVPWAALIALIEPHYPKESKKGVRPPNPLATMLQIHMLQQWYSLEDPAMEEALIEVPTMRSFAGIEPISVLIPNETTTLTFRHLLEKHDPGKQIFETVKAHLSEQRAGPHASSLSVAQWIEGCLRRRWLPEHRQKTRDGRGKGGIQSGDATW